jgi:hypothetical protein
MGLTRASSAWALAVIGAGIAAGFIAGLSGDPQQARSGPSAAEVVATSFAGAATDPGATASIERPAPTAGYALASVDSATIFSPYPFLQGRPSANAASANAAPVNVMPANPAPTNSEPARAMSTPAPAASQGQPPGHGALPRQLANADDQIPQSALAYATDEPVAAPKRASAPPRPPATSNALLNSAQIASIKERLKLSPYQAQLWPPVESALKDISWQRDPNAHKGARTIDPASPPVQRLKSAAVPLIMSLSGEQKDEVRTMVRLMGLENLAAEF